MHYVEQKRQSDIAVEMNLSTAKVNRLIKQGRDQGMLNISIQSPWQPQFDLETRLTAVSGLVDAVITPTLSEQIDIVLRSVGQAAAKYLLENLKDGDTICISGGRGVSALIEALKPAREYDVTVVPATGGVQGNLYTDVNYVATQMAEKLGGTAFQIHAPLFAETPGQRDMLLAMAQVKEVLDRARQAEIAIVGIGSILPKNSGFFELYEGAKSDRKTIVEQGAIAETIAHLIDRKGLKTNNTLNDRIIGLSLKEMHNIPLSIGVAAGVDKAQPIHSVLQGKHIKVLVSDEATANLVLDNYNKEIQ
jgi:DNA-binding transcriptional regulator LsrR (DeoR family)